MEYARHLEEGRVSQNELPGQDSQQDNGKAEPTLIPENDALTSFRLMVGIYNDAPILTSNRTKDERLINIGIYRRVVLAEEKFRWQYKYYSFLINGCLGMQIVFAAALTALGAGHGPHALVTIFGAINTVIAGIMTYLKGSGLPHKLKYYEQELTQVRETIEQFERDLCRDGHAHDVDEIYEAVMDLYEQVKGDIEMNSSDGIVSMADLQRRKIKGTANQPANQPGSRPALSRSVSFHTNAKPQDAGHCPTCLNHDHKTDVHQTVYPLPSTKSEIGPVTSLDGGKEK